MCVYVFNWCIHMYDKQAGIMKSINVFTFFAAVTRMTVYD